MTKETLFQLSTGDWVVNTETQQVYMIGVISNTVPCVKSIEDLTILANWEVYKPRLTITKEELARIEAYHEKIKKASEKAGV